MPILGAAVAEEVGLVALRDRRQSFAQARQ